MTPLARGELTRVWINVQAALPIGWVPAGVVLEEPERHVFDKIPNDEPRTWRAWALGPNGERLEGTGAIPERALTALAEAVRRWRAAQGPGSAS